MNEVIRGKNESFCIDTIAIKHNVEANFLELGMRLLRIHKHGLWREIWGSWEEYLFEMKLSAATASKLMRIYELLVEQHDISPAKIVQAGGWTVIAEVLPAMDKKLDAERWLDLATRLTRTDLRRTFHEEKHGTDMQSCPHKDTYTLLVCRDCGVRYREELQDKETQNENID